MDFIQRAVIKFCVKNYNYFTKSIEIISNDNGESALGKHDVQIVQEVSGGPREPTE